jgi:hypothetical protein
VAPFPAAPAGLDIRLAPLNKFGISYFARCAAHSYCRERGMVWSANSHEELTDRVFAAFEQHCRDMEKYAD